MNIYVQLGEAAIPPSARVTYRNGFRDFITEYSAQTFDRVIVVEPNKTLIPELELLWHSWSKVDFKVVNVSLDSGLDDRIFFSCDSHERFREVFSPDENYVRRYFPSGDLAQSDVEQYPLETFIFAVAGLGRVKVLSLDLRLQTLSRFGLINWSALPIEQLILTIDGISKSELDAVRKVLKSSGFMRAGRSWGEARTSETFRRKGNSLVRIESALAQVKVNSVEAAVAVSQLIPNDEKRSAFKDRLSVLLHPSYSRADVLDSAYGRKLTPVNLNQVEKYVSLVRSSGATEWSVLANAELSIDEVAHKCFREHNVWPISFSYPKPPTPVTSDPSEALCSITPGFPYSFDDESEYLQTYTNAYLGLTHRKAGWDCFRHIEIMASGAVPLMIDAAEIPEYSMIHYPKTAFRDVVTKVENLAGMPSSLTRASFRTHFDINLSSKAMATYMLRVSGFQDAARVLFIDEQLPGHADYQSALALIGLKQMFGVHCEVAFPVDYIYDDTLVVTANLYGRGFGYTRVLPTALRTENEKRPIPLPELGVVERDLYDLVVVGSISRNSARASELLRKFPAERTIWIHGEDSPPTIRQARQFRESGTNVFVRSIS